MHRMLLIRQADPLLYHPESSSNRLTEAQMEIVDSWTESREMGKDEVCAICYDNFEDQEVVSLPECGHYYHIMCIKNWLSIKPECPCCKRSLSHFFN